jgi:hypothetical protein
MSSSSHKSRQRKTRNILGIPIKTLPWVVGALVLLPIIGVLLFGQSAGSIDPNFTPKVSGASSLEVTQPFFDLGDQHFNNTVQVVYNLQNVGDQALHIQEIPRVEVLEGC